MRSPEIVGRLRSVLDFCIESIRSTQITGEMKDLRSRFVGTPDPDMGHFGIWEKMMETKEVELFLKKAGAEKTDGQTLDVYDAFRMSSRAGGSRCFTGNLWIQPAFVLFHMERWSKNGRHKLGFGAFPEVEFWNLIRWLLGFENSWIQSKSPVRAREREAREKEKAFGLQLVLLMFRVWSFRNYQIRWKKSCQTWDNLWELQRQTLRFSIAFSVFFFNFEEVFLGAKQPNTFCCFCFWNEHSQFAKEHWFSKSSCLWSKGFEVLTLEVYIIFS